MSAETVRNVVCDDLGHGVWVARFVRPDVRPQLYDEAGNAADCTLYKELDAAILSRLRVGNTLILNFGLIDYFPSVFFRLLLAVQGAVQSRGAQLVLCHMVPFVKEVFEILGGPRMFQVRETEARAIAEAKE